LLCIGIVQLSLAAQRGFHPPFHRCLQHCWLLFVSSVQKNKNKKKVRKNQALLYGALADVRL
jgi:hypothetical protein